MKSSLETTVNKPVSSEYRPALPLPLALALPLETSAVLRLECSLDCIRQVGQCVTNKMF